MTGTGPKIVLPNRFAEEIRNNPDLNFPKAFSKVCVPRRTEAGEVMARHPRWEEPG